MLRSWRTGTDKQNPKDHGLGCIKQTWTFNKMLTTLEWTGW
ncbi:hypothetical protein [Candidatus Hodgkinia cicadicola]